MQEARSRQDGAPGGREWSELGKRVAPSSPPGAVFLVRTLANGGMERVLLDHCLAARSAGWSPRVLALETPGPLAPRFHAQEVPVTSLELPGSPWRAPLPAIGRLTSWLRRSRPGLVQVHMRRTGALGRMVARSLSIPTLVALHNQDPPPPHWYAPLEAWLDRDSRFLAVSRAVRDHAAAQRGLDPGRIQVLPNRLPEFRAALRTRGPGASPRIGFLGKLEGKKGPDRFLDLAALLRDSGGGLRFVVIGDGPEGAGLRQRSRTQGLPVEFRGAVPEASEQLESFDLVCFPSRREGFGLAVGEALARGVPVCLADIPPFREVYGTLPEACFLPPGPVDARHRARVLALLRDPVLRARVREAGRRILERFAGPAILPRARRFYRDLLRELSAAGGAGSAPSPGRGDA